MASDLPAVILRYFSIYGPRQRPDMAYHIFTQRLMRHRPLTIYGDGRQSRSNTHVSDCVRGTLLAIDHGEVGEVYNIGGGHTITLLEAVDLIARSLRRQAVLQHRPTRQGDQRTTHADVSKAREQLGYEPRVAPAEGLAAQVSWHLEQLRHRTARRAVPVPGHDVQIEDSLAATPARSG